MGSISAGPEWEGQVTGCPHCGERINVSRSAPGRVVLAPDEERAQIPTIRRTGAAAVARSWEADFYRFHCPSCGNQARIQGMMLSDDRAVCPDCGSGIELSKVGGLTPEDPALYRLSVSRLLFSYKGRVARFHFWLLCIVPTFTLPVVAAILLQPGDYVREMNIQERSFFMLLWFLPVGLPVMIKRLHDRGKSGHLAWLLLLVLLPDIPSSEVYPALLMLGSLAQMIAPVFLMVTLGLFPGSHGVNRYGPPPSLIRFR